jgi:Sec-independent protein translocase protein TatA
MKTTWRKPLAWLVAAVVLALVFAAYRSPHLMVDLANRLWACF